MSDKKFAGKVAVVTGATSGIGHACAVGFANEGANVVCVGRKEEALKSVADEVRGAVGRSALGELARRCGRDLELADAFD